MNLPPPQAFSEVVDPDNCRHSRLGRGDIDFAPDRANRAAGPIDFCRRITAGSDLAALATANGDLIGQMANREYLERLALLFLEFREANMCGFTDLHYLLEKTQAFYRMTQTRLVTELDGLGALLDLHSEAMTGVKRNYYLEVIQRNLDYLHKLLQASPGDRISMLKRGNILDRIAHLL